MQKAQSLPDWLSASRIARCQLRPSWTGGLHPCSNEVPIEAMTGKMGTPLRRRLSRLSSLPMLLPRITEARSEEHTSELQSLMRISYAVFCLKKKKKKAEEKKNMYKRSRHTTMIDKEK